MLLQAYAVKRGKAKHVKSVGISSRKLKKLPWKSFEVIFLENFNSHATFSVLYLQPALTATFSCIVEDKTLSNIKLRA